MARPNWEYIRVDVRLPRHRKLAGEPDSVGWALLSMWAYCGEELTDGFVPDEIWRTISKPRWRQRLLDRELAERVGGGYQMHDYLEHQRSRSEVEELRAQRSAAGRRSGQARRTHAQRGVQRPVERPVERDVERFAEHPVQQTVQQALGSAEPVDNESKSSGHGRSRTKKSAALESSRKPRGPKRTGHSGEKPRSGHIDAERPVEQNANKTRTEAEAEAEAEKTHPVAEVINSNVEGVIHRPAELPAPSIQLPSGPWLNDPPPAAAPAARLAEEAERQRQIDALSEFSRTHPEAAT